MALQFDAYNEIAYTGTSTPSVSITVPASTTIIIVGFTSVNGRTATATFDGNAMTLIRQDTDPNTGTAMGFLYYVSPGTGSKTAAVTLSASDAGALFVAAIKSTATASPIDTSDYQFLNSGTTKSTALTTTQATTLLVGMGFGQRSNLAAGGGETQGAATLNGTGGGAGIYQYMSYKYVTSSGANSTTATLSPANWIDVSAIAIKEAASGPTNLKSLDTNVTANIKTYNTNPLANIKSINTNT